MILKTHVITNNPRYRLSIGIITQYNNVLSKSAIHGSCLCSKIWFFINVIVQSHLTRIV